MTAKPLTLFLLAAMLLILSPEARSTRDYMFSITGVVTTEDGTPLRDVELTLEVDGPVYEGTNSVKTVRRLTNSTGGFVFMYTSHKRGVRYKITAQKSGFEPQTISGSAPPAGHHTIRLKRSDVGGEDKH
jgi:hypothetical protein